MAGRSTYRHEAAAKPNEISVSSAAAGSQCHVRMCGQRCQPTAKCHRYSP